MLKNLPQKAQDSLIKQVCFPKRLGHPEEFGRLCGDIIENSYINGECIRLVCFSLSLRLSLPSASLSRCCLMPLLP